MWLRPKEMAEHMAEDMAKWSHDMGGLVRRAAQMGSQGPPQGPPPQGPPPQRSSQGDSE